MNTDSKRDASPKLAKGGNLVPGAASFNREIELNGNAEWPPAKYPAYLPTWDPNQKFPPLKPYDFIDRGKFADPAFPNLQAPGLSFTKLTPTIGTKVTGPVQLSHLSSAAKDELALLTAQRKLVVFEKQDFADLPIDEAIQWGGHFGRHHINATSGTPLGYPEIQLAHRGAGDPSYEDFFGSHISSAAWHSDVTYEEQPPGLTIMYILETPETGGDTLFVDTAEAYTRLSPIFQERLHGLTTLHSGVQQAEVARRKNSIVRREPIETVHPIVRTHPVTKEKAIFVNRQFTRGIIGMKREESDCILNFLYAHMANTPDLQCRVKWEPGMVILWDNRVTAHTAIFDWTTCERRHLARLTPQAERPFETPF
ncbi:hypothetical protein CKM354_000611200 [Cercospora kikuchii]|uniref:TauD/TfdA-like domain-containing protein n=1 Tax=Cercospora kikuchii TaxID=84275 RepID=A0A9P3CIS7_9PEZI|nr:uncharacterized protein CKM354_000611200 [Cercospora kikuchii]GIZ42861.1 hypothetical protein CKM354_000611200 [Cercospora kikuchii]